MRTRTRVWPAVRLAGWILLAGCVLAGWTAAVAVYVLLLDYLLTR